MKNLVIKKNNALTDGYIPKTGKELIPDKLLNALVYKYENEGDSFMMSLVEIRELLGLKSNSAKNDERIYKAFKILGTCIEMRDFEYKGRGIKWATGVFSTAKIYKDNQNFIEIKIDDTTISYLKQKHGYTPIDIDICNKFKTKYGLAIYEKIYMRYESLPNHVGNNVGYIEKDFETLNKILDTNYKTPSEILRGINRGIQEIEKITGILVRCFYKKREKLFNFSWKQKPRYTRSLSAFIFYIRKKYRPYYDNKQNKDIYPVIVSNKQGLLRVDLNGNLYVNLHSKGGEIEYLDKVQAEKLWNWLYDLAKNGKEF